VCAWPPFRPVELLVGDRVCRRVCVHGCQTPHELRPGGSLLRATWLVTTFPTREPGARTSSTGAAALLMAGVRGRRGRAANGRSSTSSTRASLNAAAAPGVMRPYSSSVFAGGPSKRGLSSCGVPPGPGVLSDSRTGWIERSIGLDSRGLTAGDARLAPPPSRPRLLRPAIAREVPKGRARKASSKHVKLARGVN